MLCRVQSRRLAASRPALRSWLATVAVEPSIRETATPKPLLKQDSNNRNTSFMWFNSVYPIRLATLDLRHLIGRVEEKKLLAEISELVPHDSAYDVKVEKVIPRQKDGGAFVKFSWSLPEIPYAEENAKKDAEEVQHQLEEQSRVLSVLENETVAALSARKVKPWWELSRWISWKEEGKAFLVKGKPWQEDMHRFPSSTVRVEFEGPEIPQEELYEIFRTYGRIVDITPPNPKDSPKFALIKFFNMRAATSARNCLNSAVVPSTLPVANPPPPTVLRILYAERHRANYIRDFASSHPRIMIPLIVALLGSISYAIFDPIREFFIRARIEGTFDADRWTLIKFLKRETLGRLGLIRASAAGPVTGIEKERENAREQLQTWIKDVPDTFIIVAGPKGSGKTGLVKDVLASGAHVLTIDCQALCKNGRSDQKLVTELAHAVGYFPQFALGQNISNLIDLASVGLIGQKAGFSSTLDVQLKAILEVTSSALAKISNNVRLAAAREAKLAETRRKQEADRKNLVNQLETEGVRDARMATVAGIGPISEVAAGIEPAEEDDQVLIIGPQSSKTVKDLNASAAAGQTENSVGQLPIVVLEGFAAKGESKNEVLWDVLAEWAAVLVENQCSHVIFTSDSVQVTKSLSKALPSVPFKSIALNDASPEAALQYIATKLGVARDHSAAANLLTGTAKESIAKLGGRQTDLELLLAKLSAGFSVDEAVEDISARSAQEIRKQYFGDDLAEASSLKWSRAQAWKLISGLCERDELKYTDVLVNLFGNDEIALRALENSELISIVHRDGRPSLIRPGKPIYKSSFAHLKNDSAFKGIILYQINANAIAATTKDLENASKSLIELSSLFAQGNGRWVFGGGSTVPLEVQTRVASLLGAMQTAEKKLETLAQEKAELLKLLSEAT